MRKSHKMKGFTLVELLVVIAIIAILATVSVVGYLSFTKKADKSVDETAVTQMNTALKAEEVVSGTPADVFAVLEILEENGFNSDLGTYYSGYTLGWYNVDGANTVVLIDDDSNTIAYPESYKGISASSVDTFNKKIVSSSEDFTTALSEALTGGEKAWSEIKLASDVSLSKQIEIESTSGEYTNISLDLNGKSISYDYAGKTAEQNTSSVFYVNDDTKLVVSNGTLGTEVTVAANYSSTTNICSGAVLYASGNGEIELDNVTVTAKSVYANTTKYFYAIATHGSDSHDSTLTIKNSTIDGSLYFPAGTVYMENTTVDGGVEVRGGTFTAINCSFKNTHYNACTDSYSGQAASNYLIKEGALYSGYALAIVAQNVSDSTAGYYLKSVTLTNCTFAGQTECGKLSINETDIKQSTDIHFDLIVAKYDTAEDATYNITLGGNTYVNNRVLEVG